MQGVISPQKGDTQCKDDGIMTLLFYLSCSYINNKVWWRWIFHRMQLAKLLSSACMSHIVKLFNTKEFKARIMNISDKSDKHDISSQSRVSVSRNGSHCKVLVVSAPVYSPIPRHIWRGMQYVLYNVLFHFQQQQKVVFSFKMISKWNDSQR